MKTILVRGDQGDDVVALKQALVEKLGSEAQDFNTLAQGTLFDADTEAAARRWQAGVGLVADGVVGPLCQGILALRTPAKLDIDASVESVRHLFPATKPANIARYLPYVAAALAVMDLTDRAMVCAALGTIRAETEGFLPISEFQSRFNTEPGGMPFARYEKPGNHLGNTTAGDGARFKGRGFVQLTGRDNYDRYGKAIGVKLIDTPELANAPEVAAVLLAQFLANHAAAMRNDLAAHNYGAARALVNGGTHGLDRFTDVFVLAEALWPVATAVAATAGARADRPRKTTRKAGKVAAAPVQRSLTVRKDQTDLKDRPYLPPTTGLREAYPSDAEIVSFLPDYTKAGLILNQGTESACTGFGLACVVNYLRWSKAGYPPKMESVSPRMFYNFARRYDEYAGENYEGSSCRGAIKGWFNHGVCLESDWPFTDQQVLQPKYGYARNATNNTLGVYYRIDMSCITDMQAAIQVVGAVYVSSFTHAGWHGVATGVTALAGHADLPVIAFDGRPSMTDGHAYAMVGFNAQGFVIQNSWGEDFGAGGFAVLTYADWLTNGMDAWVLGMGVPGVVVGRVSTNSAGAAGPAGRGVDTSAWWSEDQAYQHSVVTGNDGRVKRYLTEDELSRTLLHQVAGLPDAWFRTRPDKIKRLVIFAHGGLNSEEAAIKRARAMGRHFLGNDCYPIFLVWKTGLLESIGDIVVDAFHKQPVLTGGLREWVAEKTDLLIEKTIGRPLAKPTWSEMKINAELTFATGRGGDLLITALQKLRDTWGENLEVHVIGHSAGSILLGHLVTALEQRKLVDQVKTTHLFAPACTVDFANRHFAQNEAVMKNMYLHVLSDAVERHDNVATIYRKSLLYFVSNALESDLRTPILGLTKIRDAEYNGWDGSSATGATLKTWRQAATAAGLDSADRYTLVTSEHVPTATTTPAPGTTIEIDAAHGCFDNDIDVITATLARIRGGALLANVDDLRGF